MARKPRPRGSILVRLTQEDLDEIDAAISHIYEQGEGARMSRPDFVRSAIRERLDRLRESA